MHLFLGLQLLPGLPGFSYPLPDIHACHFTCLLLYIPSDPHRPFSKALWKPSTHSHTPASLFSTGNCDISRLTDLTTDKCCHLSQDGERKSEHMDAGSTEELKIAISLWKFESPPLASDVPNASTDVLCHSRLHSQHWWRSKRPLFLGNSVHQPNTTGFCHYSGLGNLSGQKETESASLPSVVV